jgi:hypothetical protein
VRSVLLAVVLATSCGGAAEVQKSPTVPRESAPLEGVLGEYDVRFDHSLGVLSVEARFSASAGGHFFVDRVADAYVRDVEAAPDRDGARFERVTRNGRAFEARACSVGACRLRYRYELRKAATEVDDVDVASDENGVIEAPPSTWLLAPTAPPRESLLRFRMTTTEPVKFVTGVFPSRTANGAWDITLDDLWTSPYTAFGPMRVHDVPAKDGVVQLAVAPGALGVTDEQLVRWTSDCATAVAAYFGRFPMQHAAVLLLPANGRWVGGGKTLAGGGGAIFMRLGETARWEHYHSDWVLVHEMTHLAFPTVPAGAQWAEEGLATYVEPFARARVGLLSEEEAWRGLVEGLPNGLPGPGDRGLDRTPTWGRTYWGGALFYLLADIEIRDRTQNRMGLEHALRGILAAGGNDAVRWPLKKIFETGDAAVGVPVLTDLHTKMGVSPHPVDLKALWTSLGVDASGRQVKFDPKAPRAEIRRAITYGK